MEQARGAVGVQFLACDLGSQSRPKASLGCQVGTMDMATVLWGRVRNLLTLPLSSMWPHLPLMSRALQPHHWCGPLWSDFPFSHLPSRSLPKAMLEAWAHPCAVQGLSQVRHLLLSLDA